MPKHKKTRKEKQKADLRKLSAPTAIQSLPQSLYSFSSTNIFVNSSKQHVQSTMQQVTALVQHDLSKTAYISLAILAVQIIFYVLLKTHILTVGFVRY